MIISSFCELAFNMAGYERIPYPFFLVPPEERKRVYPKGSEIKFNLVLLGKTGLAGRKRNT